VSAIWERDTGGLWRPLAPASFPAEAASHDLVENAPQMLPLAGSPQLTILGREVRLGLDRAADPQPADGLRQSRRRLPVPGP
jgi:hypothetical protein